MESHDEERVMFKAVSFGNSNGDYDIRVRKQALKRMQLDALFLLSLPGPKMMWQFGELGYDVSIDSAGRVSNKPIRWNYISNPDRHNLFLFYRLLINFKKSLPVFNTTNYSYSLSAPAKRIQLIGTNVSVTILGNFGITQTTINPSFPQTGKWFEYFSGDSITVSNVNANITLQPGEYRLYSTKYLGSPKLTLGINDTYVPASNQFVNVYPNPTSGILNIEIDNIVPAPVSLTVFDITGRVVKTMKPGYLPEGKQVISWDGRSDNGIPAGSGIYLVRVSTPLRTQIIKVIRK
jgi:hypothetical protein